MLNRIFLGMLLAAIVVGMALGRGEELTSALLEQSAGAVRLAIDMAGVMCLWSGLMKAAERAGLAAAVGKLLSPLTRRLFPKLSKKTCFWAAKLLEIKESEAPESNKIIAGTLLMEDIPMMTSGFSWASSAEI